jgi:hypothetical protein
MNRRAQEALKLLRRRADYQRGLPSITPYQARALCEYIEESERVIDEYRAILRELVEGDAHLDEYFYCGHCDREVGQGHVHAKDCPVVRARLMLGASSVEIAQQLDWPACEQDALDLAEPQEARDTADDTITLDEFCQYIDRRRKS